MESVETKWHDFFTSEVKFFIMLGTMVVGITMTYANIDKQLALTNQTLISLSTQFNEIKENTKKDVETLKLKVEQNIRDIDKLKTFSAKLESTYDLTIKQ